jgi:hypothetical protein
MTAWLSVLVPLLVMFFALGMERVESKLRESTVRPEELDELLDKPRPDEVRALFRQGTGRALERFSVSTPVAPGGGARTSGTRPPELIYHNTAVRVRETAPAMSQSVGVPPRLARR